MKRSIFYIISCYFFLLFFLLSPYSYRIRLLSPFSDKAISIPYLQQLSDGLISLHILIVFVIAVSFVAGVLLASIMAYSAKLNFLIGIVLDAFEAIPRMVILILVVALLTIYGDGSSTEALFIIFLSIAVCFIPATVRVILTYTLAEIEKPYVLSLRSSGIHLYNIILVNILLHNGKASILASLLANCRNAILLESSLFFLFYIGFGDFGIMNHNSLGILIAQYRRNLLFADEKVFIFLPIILIVIFIEIFQRLYRIMEVYEKKNN